MTRVRALVKHQTDVHINFEMKPNPKHNHIVRVWPIESKIIQIQEILIEIPNRK